MASPQERTRNNVRAGIFVLVSLLLAMSTIIVLTDMWRALFEPKHNYTVIYDVADGVQNLKSGANVRIGGMLMGEVSKVTPLTDDRSFNQIEVTLAISRKIKLFRGAEIRVAKSLIGDNAWIEIANVGEPDLGEPLNRQFDGISAPILGGLMGAVSADDTEQMVRNFQRTAQNVADLAERINKKDWPRWAEKVDTVVTWAADATVEFDALVTEGREALAAYKGVVADNRERIDETLENFRTGSSDAREVVQHFRETTVAKVDAMLDRGQEGLDTATQVVEKLNRDYDVWAPDVGEALAAARLTGQQLKLAATEVRRSPWKLLYRPERKEFEHELLYEATRAFAMAASDLRAASASAQRITDAHSVDSPLDEQTRQLVNDMLVGALERYKSAQENLAAVLFTEYRAD